MSEIWRDVQDFEGYYQVSNEGRVRSLDRTITYIDGRVYNYKGKVLSIKSTGNSGYYNFTMSVNKTPFYIDVHVLVARAFVLGYKEGLWVNHIDGNKLNNKDWNLEWSTKSENATHALDSGLTSSGEDCSWAKLTNNQVLEIYNLSHNSKEKHSDIAKRYNVTKGTVSKIKLGTTGKRITGHGL
jgi:hypothetical protein